MCHSSMGLTVDTAPLENSTPRAPTPQAIDTCQPVTQPADKYERFCTPRAGAKRINGQYHVRRTDSNSIALPPMTPLEQPSMAPETPGAPRRTHLDPSDAEPPASEITEDPFGLSELVADCKQVVSDCHRVRRKSVRLKLKAVACIGHCKAVASMSARGKETVEDQLCQELVDEQKALQMTQPVRPVVPQAPAARPRRRSLHYRGRRRSQAEMKELLAFKDQMEGVRSLKLVRKFSFHEARVAKKIMNFRNRVLYNTDEEIGDRGMVTLESWARTTSMFKMLVKNWKESMREEALDRTQRLEEVRKAQLYLKAKQASDRAKLNSPRNVGKDKLRFATPREPEHARPNFIRIHKRRNSAAAV